MDVTAFVPISVTDEIWVHLASSTATTRTKEWTDIKPKLTLEVIILHLETSSCRSSYSAIEKPKRPCIPSFPTPHVIDHWCIRPSYCCPFQVDSTLLSSTANSFSQSGRRVRSARDAGVPGPGSYRVVSSLGHQARHLSLFIEYAWNPSHLPFSGACR